jgi:hypothetical protein
VYIWKAVREAAGASRRFPRAGEDGEENGGKDGNDGDDDEELDQGEAGGGTFAHGDPFMLDGGLG